MQKLLDRLKNVSLNDAIEIEKRDPQFLALKRLYKNIKYKDVYLALILSNAIVCYQLSSTGEEYWTEFSDYFSKNCVSKSNLTEKISLFVKNSRGNKRFLEAKITRLQKIKPFLANFIGNEGYFFNFMTELCKNLARAMNQKVTDKTIVFAVKMFSYGARNYFNKLIEFPFEISIPIDSRLKKIYEVYNEDENLKISDFYGILSKKIAIPPLHLDSLLWLNYGRLIEFGQKSL